MSDKHVTLLALAHEAGSHWNELKHTNPIMATHWAEVRNWLLDHDHDGWEPFTKTVKGDLG